MAKEKATAAAAGAESQAKVVVEGEPEVVPTQEEIAALAYSLWEARGMNAGSSEEDWFCAEEQLRAQGRNRE